MPETNNTAKMAEFLADEVFSEFMWTKSGPVNIDWKCEKDSHGKKTHPTDVVFYYDEPYYRLRTYVNCDLKSYSATSIKPSAIKAAVESLAMQISCAEVSEEWQSKYVAPDMTSQVIGLLFVYNHDGAYDPKFSNLLSSVRLDKLDLPPGRRLMVFGPDLIHWLDNVRYDIRQLRGGGKLPSKDQCRFFHPHLVQRPNQQENAAAAATVEMLTSQMVCLKHAPADRSGREGLLVYYRGAPTVHNFQYLIDYFRHLQFLTEHVSIRIRMLAGSDEVKSQFQLAVASTIAREGEGENTDLARVLRAISCEAMTHLHTVFSDVEIGMDYA